MAEETNNFDEQMHASAVQFLIYEDDREAAIALLSCTLDLEQINTNFGINIYTAILRGSRSIYEKIRDKEHPITKSILAAFNAVFPTDSEVDYLTAKANLIDVTPDWKTQMLEIALGKEAHNQGIEIKDRATISWNNLRFRSETEKRIAQALDKAGVLFLPNCLARLNTPEGRKNKEPDFVICKDGKWGILEIDGPFHTPATAAEEHERDRYFRDYGIKVERYKADKCYQQPDKVVTEFLNLLKK